MIIIRTEYALRVWLFLYFVFYILQDMLNVTLAC